MKKKYSKWLVNRKVQTTVLISGLMFLSTYAAGQLRIDRVVSPSFNAASLIKYCDHPVGTRYGIPKIKFPFKTLMYRDINIPMSISYHSLGIRVEEESTWVGLGWRLNAGGIITRIVRGENDFGKVENDDSHRAVGYPFENIRPCLDDCSDNENTSFHEQVCGGQIDSDPDIFFFDILGMKGKFLLTPNHDIEKKFIEIELSSARLNSIKYYIEDNYWVAEDRRGFRYTFKTREKTESYDNYFDYKFESHKVHFLSYSNQLTTAWYLDRIDSPQGATAIFKYNADGDEYVSRSAFQKMNINDEDVWDVHYSSYCFPEQVENVQIVSEYWHHNVYLSSISCGDFTAIFNKSQQADVSESSLINRSETESSGGDISIDYGNQKLDNIVIQKNGKEIGRSEFYYSYFNENSDDQESHLYLRLRLDSLLIKNDGKERMVGFSYREDVKLPSKESRARDLWGFFNGEEDLYNITPSDFFNYSQPEKLLQEEGKAKHYSLKHLQAGILKKIDFGAERTREFTYDHQEFEEVAPEVLSHFSDKMINTNFKNHVKPFIFGGLRIKEIVDSFPEEKVYKEFDYKANGIEIGRLSISPFQQEHGGFGYKASGSHQVIYDHVKIHSGKIFRGKKF